MPVKKATVQIKIQATLWAEEDWDDAEMIEYLKQYHEGQHPRHWTADGIVDQEHIIEVTDMSISEEDE